MMVEGHNELMPVPRFFSLFVRRKYHPMTNRLMTTLLLSDRDEEKSTLRCLPEVRNRPHSESAALT
jgi:hypothetical protein